MKFKNVLLTFMLVFTVSKSSWAQNDKSGAGNGSLSKDVLDYEAQLNDADDGITSLKEAFAQLEKTIADLATSKIPELKGVDVDFWTKLTDKDINNIKNIDLVLINKVITVTQEIENLKKSILTELAIIDRLKREAPKLIQEIGAKKFNKNIKNRRESLENNFLNKIVEITASLIKFDNDRWIFGRGGDYYGFTYPRKNIDGCETPTCVKIIKEALSEYFDLVKEFSNNTRITFLQYDNVVLNEIAGGEIGTRINMVRIFDKSTIKGLNKTLDNQCDSLIYKMTEANIRKNN